MIALTAFEELLTKVVKFDSSLSLATIDPHMPNGLQVQGKVEVKKVGFGVSASLALFQKAADAQCDALIVHHGMTLPPTPGYDRIFQERYSFLLQHKISLFGFHFLLDAHPTLGNNAQIIKQLRGTIVEPFFFAGAPWGYIGEVRPTTIAEVAKTLTPHLSPTTKVYKSGPDSISRIAVISGKGVPHSGDIQALIDKKIDLYITGEVHEWVRELFREAGIHYLAGGHYHTERFGLLALQRQVQKKCDAETVFLELENEV